MKKLLSMIIVALSAVALNAQAIYVVDLQKVHANYYKTKAADAKLKSSAETSREELGRMDEQLSKMQKELESIDEKLKNPALNEAAKKKIIEEEAQPKVMQFNAARQERENWMRNAQQKLQQNAQSILAVHRKEIVDVIQKVAEQKKADFVLEKSAALFSKPTSDITEDVINLLNAGNK